MLGFFFVLGGGGGGGGEGKGNFVYSDENKEIKCLYRYYTRNRVSGGNRGSGGRTPSVWQFFVF